MRVLCKSYRRRDEQFWVKPQKRGPVDRGASVGVVCLLLTLRDVTNCMWVIIVFGIGEASIQRRTTKKGDISVTTEETRGLCLVLRRGSRRPVFEGGEKQIGLNQLLDWYNDQCRWHSNRVLPLYCVLHTVPTTGERGNLLVSGAPCLKGFINNFFSVSLLLSSFFWTSCGLRCRPFSPSVRAFSFYRA